ncbi:MAG: hypothetical protein KDD59_12300 [Bdellovibrionales bacterium]|nr:hypothetical protein [Bdellovibrionales bacterium]
MERNSGNKKKNIDFETYMSLIEELLQLTGRKIKPRPKLNEDSFHL